MVVCPSAHHKCHLSPNSGSLSSGSNAESPGQYESKSKQHWVELPANSRRVKKGKGNYGDSEVEEAAVLLMTCMTLQSRMGQNAWAVALPIESLSE